MVFDAELDSWWSGFGVFDGLIFDVGLNAGHSVSLVRLGSRSSVGKKSPSVRVCVLGEDLEAFTFLETLLGGLPVELELWGLGGLVTASLGEELTRLLAVRLRLGLVQFPLYSSLVSA